MGIKAMNILKCDRQTHTYTYTHLFSCFFDGWKFWPVDIDVDLHTDRMIHILWNADLYVHRMIHIFWSVDVAVGRRGAGWGERRR